MSSCVIRFIFHLIPFVGYGGYAGYGGKSDFLFIFNELIDFILCIASGSGYGGGYGGFGGGI